MQSGWALIPLMGFMYFLFRKKESRFQEFFAVDYYEARHKFRKQVRRLQLEHHILRIQENDSGDFDLSIDIAIIPGDSDKLVIHISGTHGVEGFAGSAIQTGFLSSYVPTPNRPTIVLIHAMNPFGFALLRRWNENGVDLNRNALFDPQQFKEKHDRDPNQFHYLDMYSLLNPPKKLGAFDFFYLKALRQIIKYGFVNAKKAVVSGNYHFKDSLFFGGFELQKSHQLVKQFLLNRFDTAKVSHVSIIDVHTGLGPKGFDTILLFQSSLSREVFGKEQHHVVESNHAEQSALSGYDDVAGTVPESYQTLFPNATTTCFLTQEFGTVPGVVVLKALRAELAAHLHDPSQLSKAREKVRDVFYLKDDADWKDNVIRRGLFVLQQIWNELHTQ
jgi:hypothetical protein